jgi:hypothetical protein
MRAAHISSRPILSGRIRGHPLHFSPLPFLRLYCRFFAAVFLLFFTCSVTFFSLHFVV